MDMKNILKSFDQVEKGEHAPASKAESGSMKALLESFDSIATECGEMSAPAAMPQPDKVRMNVNLSAEGTDGIQDLMDLLGKANPATSNIPMKMPEPTDRHDDMKRMMTLVSDDDMDMEEEWDNAPDEEYSDHKTMTQDLSGGINRKKKQFKAAEPGDNPMAMEGEELQQSIKEQLLQALSEKKKISAKDDPCWKGYKMVGTKKKGGKEVPNCVPGKKGD